jgi:DNA-binding sugar fermentation-stimulating protein
MACTERDIDSVYEGETGRSARTRGAEHLKELEKKKNKSVLYKHKLTTHENESVKFKMEITGKFKDALTRQANEAVRIYSRPAQESMNSKSEFNHPPLARVVVERKVKFS